MSENVTVVLARFVPRARTMAQSRTSNVHKVTVHLDPARMTITGSQTADTTPVAIRPCGRAGAAVGATLWSGRPGWRDRAGQLREPSPKM